MDKDLVSIIIATKNGGKLISRAITSIESQTEKNVEVIVISDGSTDDTPRIVNELSEIRPWLRLIELSENVGPGLARDRGIREAKGAFIALIDDDDVWGTPFKLKIQEEFLHTHPDHVLVGASTINEITIEDKALSVFNLPEDDGDIRRMMFLRNCFVTSSVMFRKEAYLKAGNFNSLYLAEDYDLWFRMGRVGKFANIPKCDTGYTIHPKGASKIRQRDLYRAILSIIPKYRKDYPGFIRGYIKACLRVIYADTFGRAINITRFTFLRKLFRKVA